MGSSFPDQAEFERAIAKLCFQCGIDGHQHAANCSKRRHEDLFPNHQEFEYEIAKICSKCGRNFTRASNRIRHEGICSVIYNATCKHCQHKFTDTHNHKRHEQVCEKPPFKRSRRTEPAIDELLASRPDAEGIAAYETAFACRLKSFFIRSDENLDLTQFLQSIKQKVFN